MITCVKNFSEEETRVLLEREHYPFMVCEDGVQVALLLAPRDNPDLANRLAHQLNTTKLVVDTLQLVDDWLAMREGMSPLTTIETLIQQALSEARAGGL